MQRLHLWLLLIFVCVPSLANAGAAETRPRGQLYYWLWAKNMEGYWQDFIDFAAEQKMDGVVIWGLKGFGFHGEDRFCRELVKYAHARISSVLRNAAELGIDWRQQEFDPGLLADPAEAALLGVLAEFPRIVTGAAELREPHRIARYLEQLATAYHKFYDSCRVLPRGDEEVDATGVARLWLCAATRQVVANGLQLCGVSAPERM